MPNRALLQETREQRASAEGQDSPEQACSDGGVGFNGRSSQVGHHRNQGLDQNCLSVTHRLPKTMLHEPAEMKLPPNVVQQVHGSMETEHGGGTARALVQRIVRP